MRKALLIIVLLLLVFTPRAVSAIIDPNVEMGEEKREEMQQRIEAKRQLLEQRREELRQRLESARAERQAQLDSKRRERIRAYFSRMIKRFEAAIARLERLIERIEARIAKLKEQGENTSTVEARVTEAKDLLQDAKSDVEAVNQTLEEILNSSDPKSEFKAVREFISDTKHKLIEVHRMLVEVIGDIKGLRVGQYKSPTPKPTKPLNSPTPQPTE